MRSQQVDPPADPRVLDLDDETAATTLSALSSETARTILSDVYEDPSTPAELRAATGTSLQNVHYHLEKLEAADLVRPAGTAYSEKGREMTVYAPANTAVVLFAGEQSSHSRLERALGRLLGAVALLAVAAVAFAQVVQRFQPASGGDRMAATTTEAGAETATQVIPSLDPTVGFVLGGLFVLTIVSVWWGVRTWRS
jgi:DNA-binding transcriptional ArsR family regulator